ncbi:MAG: MATE family efflux transporter [Lachnospiraceae bacterium]|nr:MATE family efflux transporter [Lachnospiraceae bacterium]
MTQTSEKKQSQHFERMTTADVTPLIVRLSIPSILTMLVTNIYNLADTAFVGRLGTSASGAVGIVFAYMSIIQAFGFMFGQGAGSILSRALGARDQEYADRTASTGFFCSFGFGMLLALVSWFLIDPLIRILGSTETIAPYARIYISYILLAAPFMTASFTMNQILRYEGKSALGMIGMMTGGILNMIGDPILMFGFHMGIAGAGLSTCLSQIIGFCILFWMFLGGRSLSRISPRYFSGSPAHILDIMATGLPSTLRQAMLSISAMMMNSCSAVYGDAAVAAMSIVSRIVNFAFSIAVGVGQGFQPVSAFNYGAAKYSRVRKAYRATVKMGYIMLGIMVAGLLVWSGSLIGIFRDDPEVIRIGTPALKIQAVSLLALPMTMTTEMLYQSTGKKWGASILSLLRCGILFIPTLLILAKFRGLAGIGESKAVSFVLSVFPAWYFRQRFFREMPEEDDLVS